MLLTELVAIGAMLGAFGLIPLILWFIKTKPVQYPPLEPLHIELKDYRVIKLRARM